MERILKCTQEDLTEAAIALKEGHLVAFPTETVYGLGADATNEKAISRIYTVKSRPATHPLIVHIARSDQLNEWARNIPNYARSFTEEFWPGPLTLVLQRSKLAKNFVTGNQDLIALRIPNHKATLYLLEKFIEFGGKGVAAPSANRFGMISPTSANAVVEEIGSYLKTGDLILDGNKSAIGIESTIVDCTSQYPKILRPGAITIEMLKVFSKQIAFNENHQSDKKFPGDKISHYSPKSELVLDVVPEIGDGFIALENFSTPEGVVRLAAPKNSHAFANELYSAMREGDRIKCRRIVVRTPDGTGLDIAIRDRLTKAAKRPDLKGDIY